MRPPQDAAEKEENRHDAQLGPLVHLVLERWGLRPLRNTDNGNWQILLAGCAVGMCLAPIENSRETISFRLISPQTPREKEVDYQRMRLYRSSFDFAARQYLNAVGEIATRLRASLVLVEDSTLPRAFKHEVVFLGKLLPQGKYLNDPILDELCRHLFFSHKDGSQLENNSGTSTVHNARIVRNNDWSSIL